MSTSPPPMTPDDFVLYNYWRSSSTWRVRTVLHLKGIEYKSIAYNILNKPSAAVVEQYHKLNPLGVVPTLIHQQHAIGQSQAIMEYIEMIRPEPRLIPADPYTAALCRQLCQIVVADIQPIGNLKVLQKIEEWTNAQRRAEWSAHWIAVGLAAFESLVITCAGTYCIGDEVTLADAVLVPQLYNARRFNVDLTPYPTCVRIEEACMELDAFKAAHPDQQADNPDRPATTAAAAPTTSS